ncbi:hypothetical protein D3C81_1370180 [compost metagenome]
MLSALLKLSNSPSSTIHLEMTCLTLSLLAGSSTTPSAISCSSAGASCRAQRVLPRFCFDTKVSTPRATTPSGSNAAATPEINQRRIRISFSTRPSAMRVGWASCTVSKNACRRDCPSHGREVIQLATGLYGLASATWHRLVSKLATAMPARCMQSITSPAATSLALSTVVCRPGTRISRSLRMTL